MSQSAKICNLHLYVNYRIECGNLVPAHSEIEGSKGLEEISSVLFLASYSKVGVPLLDGSTLELFYAKSGVRLPE